MTGMILGLAAGGVVWLGFYMWDKKARECVWVRRCRQTVLRFGKRVAADAEPLRDTPIDYGRYKLTGRQYATVLLVSGGSLFGIGILFYDRPAAAAVLSAGALFFPRYRALRLALKRNEDLNDQFKQALYSISSLLSAGKSVENAFREAVRDLHILYPHAETAIIRELERINRKLENGETIEQALLDFSRRAGSEEIRNFTEVFVTCKRTGGNLVEVVRRTAGIIAEKIEVKQEIAVMMAQKKFESRVLSGAPLVVLAFLRFSSPDYMSPLYHGILGAAVMTVCLAVLAVCFWVSQNIMKIDV